MSRPEIRIEKASAMGFCSGVRRAVTVLERAAETGGPLQTLGPAVHNRPVVDRLALLGVTVAPSPDKITGSRAAIPSHGASPEVTAELTKRAVQVVDATCPIVHRAQLAAQQLGKEGFLVVVFGDAEHPEVRGILGWAGPNSLAARDVLPLKKLAKWPRKIGVVAQTTQSSGAFRQFVKDLLDLARSRFNEIRVVNTVCEVTHRQQEAASKLAKHVDLMLVVGGTTSSNTRRLAESCEAAGAETRRIETADEIEASWLQGKKSVGVTAATSTPEWSIDEVIARIQELSRQDNP